MDTDYIFLILQLVESILIVLLTSADLCAARKELESRLLKLQCRL